MTPENEALLACARALLEEDEPWAWRARSDGWVAARAFESGCLSLIRALADLSQHSYSDSHASLGAIALQVLVWLQKQDAQEAAQREYEEQRRAQGETP